MRGGLVGSGGGLVKLYVAHPMTSYGTGHEARMLAVLTACFPEAEVVNPSAQCWQTDDDWLEDWGTLLPSLDLLVVFAGPDGTIGAGCLREVADALARCIPVLALDNDGQLRAFGGLSVDEPVPRPRSIGRLVLGEPAEHFTKTVTAKGALAGRLCKVPS
jgi:hypothetical protein